MQPPPPDANTFRIFVSTDNHLGFGEDSKYPPRADDSFRAVEEVLTNAKKYEARTPFPSFRRPMHFPCCLTPWYAKCACAICNTISQRVDDAGLRMPGHSPRACFFWRSNLFRVVRTRRVDTCGCTNSRTFC